MLKTESKEIDGRTYTVTVLPGLRAGKLLTRLGALVGPALARVTGAVKSDDEVAFAEAAGAIEALTGALKPEDFESIVRELLYSTSVDVEGKAKPLFVGANGANFDMEMSGAMGTVFKLLAFAFTLNYGDFSTAVGPLIRRVLVPAASRSKV